MTLPSDMLFVDLPRNRAVRKRWCWPAPRAAADEVLIRVMAAGVNRPDVLQRSGRYPPPPGASPVLGLECAGEVVAFGAA